jgi:hypothetical protein
MDLLAALQRPVAENGRVTPRGRRCETVNRPYFQPAPELAFSSGRRLSAAVRTIRSSVVARRRMADRTERERVAELRKMIDAMAASAAAADASLANVAAMAHVRSTGCPIRDRLPQKNRLIDR